MENKSGHQISRILTDTFGEYADRNSSLELVENKQEDNQQTNNQADNLDNIMIRSDLSDKADEGENEYERMFVNLIQKACEALRESREKELNNSLSKKQQFNSERNKIDILIEWTYHCILKELYLTAKNTLCEVQLHCNFIKESIKSEQNNLRHRKSMLKILKVICAYISILKIFVFKKLYSKDKNLTSEEELQKLPDLFTHIRKCSKLIKLNEFSKLISKTCCKLNKIADKDIINKFNVSINDIKEMQEYKKLCDPVRVSTMSDLPKIAEYFVDKLKGKEKLSKHCRSNTKLIYPSLHSAMNISEPILKISKRPSSHIMTSRSK